MKWWTTVPLTHDTQDMRGKDKMKSSPEDWEEGGSTGQTAGNTSFLTLEMGWTFTYRKHIGPQIDKVKTEPLQDIQ